MIKRSYTSLGSIILRLGLVLFVSGLSLNVFWFIQAPLPVTASTTNARAISVGDNLESAIPSSDCSGDSVDIVSLSATSGGYSLAAHQEGSCGVWKVEGCPVGTSIVVSYRVCVPDSAGSVELKPKFVGNSEGMSMDTTPFTVTGCENRTITLTGTLPAGKSVHVKFDTPAGVGQGPEFKVESTCGSTSTATATNTPVTPTATNTPVTPTATNTPVTPTATNTPVTPTATNTPKKPTHTSTPVPPTATNTPLSQSVVDTPTNTPIATSTAAAVVYISEVLAPAPVDTLTQAPPAPTPDGHFSQVLAPAPVDTFSEVLAPVPAKTGFGEIGNILMMSGVLFAGIGFGTSRRKRK